MMIILRGREIEKSCQHIISYLTIDAFRIEYHSLERKLVRKPIFIPWISLSDQTLIYYAYTPPESMFNPLLPYQAVEYDPVVGMSTKKSLFSSDLIRSDIPISLPAANYWYNTYTYNCLYFFNVGIMNFDWLRHYIFTGSNPFPNKRIIKINKKTFLSWDLFFCPPTMLLFFFGWFKFILLFLQNPVFDS